MATPLSEKAMREDDAEVFQIACERLDDLIAQRERLYAEDDRAADVADGSYYGTYGDQS